MTGVQQTRTQPATGGGGPPTGGGGPPGGPLGGNPQQQQQQQQAAAPPVGLAQMYPQGNTLFGNTPKEFTGDQTQTKYFGDQFIRWWQLNRESIPLEQPYR